MMKYERDGALATKENCLSRPISWKLTCHSKTCDWRVTNTAPCQRYCLSREWSRKKTASLATVVIWTYLGRFTSRCVRKVLWCANGFDLWVILTFNRGVWRSLHTGCEMNKRPENVQVQKVQNSARPWDRRSCSCYCGRCAISHSRRVDEWRGCLRCESSGKKNRYVWIYSCWKYFFCANFLVCKALILFCRDFKKCTNSLRTAEFICLLLFSQQSDYEWS